MSHGKMLEAEAVFDAGWQTTSATVGGVNNREGEGEVGTEIGLICLAILEYVLQIWQGNDLTVLKM